MRFRPLQTYSLNKLLLAAIAALFISAMTLTGSAHAADFTWTGGGADANFSTDANWSGGTAPTGVATDVLIFNPADVDFDAKSPNNDLTGAEFGGIQVGPQDGTNFDNPAITGNAFSLAGDISTSADPAGGVALDVAVTLTTASNWNVVVFTNGGGSVATNGNTLSVEFLNIPLVGADDVNIGRANFNDTTVPGSSFTGAVIVDTGLSSFPELSLNTNDYTGDITIPDGAVLCLATGTDGRSFSNNISVGGADSIFVGLACGFGGGGTPPAVTATLTGTVSLTANTTVNIGDNLTLKINDLQKNGFSIAKNASSDGGTLILPGGVTEGVEKKTITIAADDKQPSTSLNVAFNETVILNGERGFVDVDGILKGTGKTGILSVNDGGVLAPGLSPGCMSSGDLSLYSGATYEFEVLNATACSGYDQMQVTGVVSVTDAVLDVTVLEDFELAAGDELVIISNDASDAVTGTFQGLAEGDTIAAGDGGLFRISYVGGDGNDVSLTVVNVPTAPDAGFEMLVSNPLVPLAATSAVIAAAFVLRRRLFNK